MKAKFFLFGFLFSFSFLSIVVQAQDIIYKKSKIEDNWFIRLGAGGQMLFGDNDTKADWTDRISVMPSVSVGKWINPCWGVQVQAQGGALHGYENEGNFRQKDKYYNVHLDAIWNLTNQLCGYSPDRKFHISPYVGLGFAHRFQMDENEKTPQSTGVQANYKDYSNAFSVNGGIKLDIKLNNRISFGLDFGASVLPDYFDRIVYGNEYEAILSASGGLTFKLGKTDFESVTPMDLSKLDKLNLEINQLRDENNNLKIQLAAKSDTCPDCPNIAPITTFPTEINYIPNVVFFQLNSFKIDEEQQFSIYSTAEYTKENGNKLRITGYADKDTGSSSYNLKLSEKRAKAVAQELIMKYNVPSEDIIVKWKGAEEQLYGNEKWNRIVVMEPVK